MDIIDYIYISQGDVEEATLELVKKFDPLIKKYAYKLSYEDSYNDLLVDFLCLIKNVKIENFRSRTDGVIVTYIATSMRSFYIKRLKHLKKISYINSFSDLSETKQYYIESIPYIENHFENVELSTLKNVLTTKEFQTLQLIYVYNISAEEIAKHFGVSRQSVNQTKRRALEKLKKQIKSEEKC